MICEWNGQQVEQSFWFIKDGNLLFSQSITHPRLTLSSSMRRDVVCRCVCVCIWSGKWCYFKIVIYHQQTQNIFNANRIEIDEHSSFTTDVYLTHTHTHTYIQAFPSIACNENSKTLHVRTDTRIQCEEIRLRFGFCYFVRV